MKTLIAPRIVRKSTVVALSTTRRKMVAAAMASRTVTTANAAPSRFWESVVARGDRRDEGRDRGDRRQAAPGARRSS